MYDPTITDTSSDASAAFQWTIENARGKIIVLTHDFKIDSIMYANEMNMNHHLNKELQYSFYLNSLRKRKRYSSWIRKDTIKDIEYVKTYYGYNNEKAEQALKILNKTQINFIKQKLETGASK